MRYEQGGVKQLINLYQVRLIFIGKLDFHTDLTKVETRHSRNRVQKKKTWSKKFRTILLDFWWPPKLAILDGAESESRVDVLA